MVLRSFNLYVFIAILTIYICYGVKLDKKPTNKPIKQRTIVQEFNEKTEVFKDVVTRNPLSTVLTNIYDFFYWLPRRNILYDTPPVFWKNTSLAQYIQWYQFPHNLPPYRYLDNAWPVDFFCYGLPGNTLPLGDWDPFGFQLVSEKVVKKYRESELKHGRLAMLSSIAMITQENYHPLHKDIGGLAITHMEQLSHLTLEKSIIYQSIVSLTSFIQQLISSSFTTVDTNIVTDTTTTTNTISTLTTEFTSSSLTTSSLVSLSDTSSTSTLLSDMTTSISHINLPLDYILIWAFLLSIENAALYRNWSRWLDNEYNNQFDHNIGLGNLKPEYENGDYKFDPLKWMPENPEDQRDMKERELNNGRLAMIAAIGMIGQEYFTGLPIMEAFNQGIENLL